jgi:hypothetical protein
MPGSGDATKKKERGFKKSDAFKECNQHFQGGKKRNSRSIRCLEIEKK